MFSFSLAGEVSRGLHVVAVIACGLLSGASQAGAAGLRLVCEVDGRALEPAGMASVRNTNSPCGESCVFCVSRVIF